jgi:hypothetical protein
MSNNSQYNDFSKLELDGSLLMGISTTIPFNDNCNMAPRNIYQYTPTYPMPIFFHRLINRINNKNKLVLPRKENKMLLPGNDTPLTYEVTIFI